MTFEDDGLLLFGGLLLLGLATDYLGRVTRLPRVTLLLLFGVVLGKDVSGALPASALETFPIITTVALLFVGFLLGGQIELRERKTLRREILFVSISVVMGTVMIVGGGLFLLGQPIALVLILAAIATATDPAATLDVIDETAARGSFTDVLRGVVAIDDAWGLVAFSAALAVVSVVLGQGESLWLVVDALREVIGAMLLGVLLGVPMAWLSGRIRPGRPTLVEALGIVLVCGGLAHRFDVSLLLSAMTLGFVVRRFATHHERPFHAIENIEWPFMILFFVMTGASLSLDSLWTLGPLVGLYLALRTIARLASAAPGVLLLGAQGQVPLWSGAALLPQAGVATGMALVAAERLPQHADTILSLVVASTIVFELVGPIVTRFALTRAGETHAADDARPSSETPRRR